MKPKDFVIYVEGYNRRVLDQHEIARRQAYFMTAPHVKERLTMQKFFKDYWPLPTDKENEISDRLKKRIEQIKAKRKNGG